MAAVEKISEPIAAGTRPFEFKRPQLFKKYYWCSCGLSDKQPFCDKSHKNTDFKPVAFTVDD